MVRKITKKYMDRRIIIKKVDKLRHRISSWCKTNGHENLGNASEHRDDKGRLIWKQSDWEYVDDTYNQIVNNENYKPYLATLKRMNTLWKKYYITEKIGDSY